MYATPCGVNALVVNRSCGRSKDVVVSRLIWPFSEASAKSEDASRAGVPTARLMPVSESSMKDG
jgi:hypothetical protein